MSNRQDGGFLRDSVTGALVIAGKTVESVASYGAAGNGTTDDTAAVAAAITAVNNKGGGIVYFPAGTYLVSSTLTHYANTTFEGASRESATIKLAANANVDLLASDGFATNVGSANLGPNGQGLRRITLDANQANQTSLARCWAHYGYNPTVDDVWFLNGWGCGVYSEWGGDVGTSTPEEGVWRNFKIFHYGGTPGAVGLDWNGPHDSQISHGHIATFDSLIRPTDVAYGATPINGSSAAFPSSNTPFTFVTTAAAPTTLFPASGGTFVVPIVGITATQTTWTQVAYTSAATVSSVTTFSGCTAQVSTNRSVVASSGIVQPTYGLRINMGSHGHGESALQLQTIHIYGRNHFCLQSAANTPYWAEDMEIEGAFIVCGIVNTKSRFQGTVYGTLGQAGQVNECGLQLGTDQAGAGAASIDALIYNVGSASSTSGANIVSLNSVGGNLVRVRGTTSNPLFAVMGTSADLVECYCQSNQALSQVFDRSGANKYMAAALLQNRVQPTYSAAIAIAPQSGPWQTITVTNGTAFTINNPSGAVLSTAVSAVLTIEIFNNSGGAMGAITWGTFYQFLGSTWTNPANGKRRFARFEYNGNSQWVLTSMSAADY